jgi:hypothetical protein
MAKNSSDLGTPIFTQIAADHKKLKEFAEIRGQATQLQIDITRLRAVKTMAQLAQLIETMEQERAKLPITKRKTK